MIDSQEYSDGKLRRIRRWDFLFFGRKFRPRSRKELQTISDLDEVRLLNRGRERMVGEMVGLLPKGVVRFVREKKRIESIIY